MVARRTAVEIEIILEAYVAAYRSAFPDRETLVATYQDGWAFVRDASQQPEAAQRVRLTKLVDWTRNLNRKANRDLAEQMKTIVAWDGYPPNRRVQAAYYLRRREDREVKVALWLPPGHDVGRWHNAVGLWLTPWHTEGLYPTKAPDMFELVAMVPEHIRA